MRYENRRKLDHEFTSPLCKLRALAVHVPCLNKPEATVLKPVFNGVYINTKGAHTGTVIVMIVSDRPEA